MISPVVTNYRVSPVVENLDFLFCFLFLTLFFKISREKTKSPVFAFAVHWYTFL